MSGHDQFNPPSIGQPAIRRGAVLQLLDPARPKRLTTIVAPAGYGKTSLGSQWHGLLGDQGGIDLCWISLEAEHSDHAAFLLALMEAFGPLLPGASMGDGGLPTTALASILMTRLRKLTRPVVVFLDDYQFAQTDVTDALLAKLLADRTLDHVKLVVIARRPPGLPLSALRLRDEVKHIGVADLSFSDAEAHAFFIERSVNLTEQQITSLNRRTEGWAVALQMVSILVAEARGSEALLASLDGGGADMGAYLSEQVFEHLPDDICDVLVETAALPAFNRPLLEAVLENSERAGMLGRLVEYALPITLLSGPGNWIRFHPVFKDFLCDTAARRGIDVKCTLSRAASWFEAQGDIDRAVGHAILAGDATLAGRIIETAGGWQCIYATHRGGVTLFQALSGRAAEIELARFPLATLGLAILNAKTAQLDAANHYLAIAERAFVPGDALSKDLRVVKILIALYTDHWVSDLDLSALEDDLRRPGTIALIHRALALNMLSYNFLIRSDFDRALHYGRLAAYAFRDGGADFGAMHLHTHIGQACFFSGDCDGALTSYDHLIAEAQTNVGPGSDFDAVGQVLKAELLSIRGETEAAAELIAWALPHLENHDTWFDLLAGGFMAEQRVLRAKGNHSGADDAIHRMRATARRRGLDRLARLIEGERAILLIAAGDVDQAIRHAEANGFSRKAIGSDRGNALSHHLRGTVPALFWTRAFLASGDTAQARATFNRLVTLQARRPNVPRSIELALLEIAILAAEDGIDRAVDRLSHLALTSSLAEYRALIDLEPVLRPASLRTLARHPVMPGAARERLEPLLAESRNGGPQTSGLTWRERKVLELLSAGLSNKEIGRTLLLSENTIKFHLRNIFAKLHVSTRTAAVMATRGSVSIR